MKSGIGLRSVGPTICVVVGTAHVAAPTPRPAPGTAFMVTPALATSGSRRHEPPCTMRSDGKTVNECTGTVVVASPLSLVPGDLTPSNVSSPVSTSVAGTRHARLLCICTLDAVAMSTGFTHIGPTSLVTASSCDVAFGPVGVSSLAGARVLSRALDLPVHTAGSCTGKYKTAFKTLFKKSREGPAGGTSGLAPTRSTSRVMYPHKSSSFHVSSRGAAALASGATGDSTELCTKCGAGAKDLGNSTLGYGGTSDCSDLSTPGRTIV